MNARLSLSLSLSLSPPFCFLKDCRKETIITKFNAEFKCRFFFQAFWCCFFAFLRPGFTLWPRLAWNLFRLGWPHTCSNLPALISISSTAITGMSPSWIECLHFLFHPGFVFWFLSSVSKGSMSLSERQHWLYITDHPGDYLGQLQTTKAFQPRLHGTVLPAPSSAYSANCYRKV